MVNNKDNRVFMSLMCLRFSGKYASFKNIKFPRGNYLTIRPVARKGYGSIAHEAKPNGLLTRGP